MHAHQFRRAVASAQPDTATLANVRAAAAAYRHAAAHS